MNNYFYSIKGSTPNDSGIPLAGIDQSLAEAHDCEGENNNVLQVIILLLSPEIFVGNLCCRPCTVHPPVFLKLILPLHNFDSVVIFCGLMWILSIL